MRCDCGRASGSHAVQIGHYLDTSEIHPCIVLFCQVSLTVKLLPDPVFDRSPFAFCQSVASRDGPVAQHGADGLWRAAGADWFEGERDEGASRAAAGQDSGAAHVVRQRGQQHAQLVSLAEAPDAWRPRRGLRLSSDFARGSHVSEHCRALAERNGTRRVSNQGFRWNEQT